jgi:hypothetical protein
MLTFPHFWSVGYPVVEPFGNFTPVLPHKSRKMRWAGQVARMVKERNVYRILVENPEEMITLGRPRRRCVVNIKMDLREIGWGGMDWIDLVQHTEQWRALVNTVMNLRVP